MVLLLKQMKHTLPFNTLHFASCKHTEEDKGMADCAKDAGIHTEFVYAEDIGISECEKFFTDNNSKPIDSIFKLYPWEYMHRDKPAKFLANSQINRLEP